jgi:hypothetical protein
MLERSREKRKVEEGIPAAAAQHTARVDLALTELTELTLNF